MTRGLTGRLLAVSAVILLLCAGTFAVVLHTVSQLRHATDDLRTSNARIETGKELLKLVVDLETGMRGYVVTQDPKFLEPWNEAQHELPSAEQDFLRANAGDPRQEAAARQIVAGVEDYRAWQREQVDTARRDVKAAIKAIAAGEGKRRVDALRRQFAALERREVVASEAERNDVEAASDRAVALIVGGLIVVPLLVILLTAYLIRTVIRPMRRVADAAGRVEAGDLDTRVAEDGPGEVGMLGRSFNAMATSLRSTREDLEAHNAELEAQGHELARAVDELAHEKERIETFHAVVGALSAQAEYEQLVPDVLGVLRAASRADVGALYVVDPVEPQRGLPLAEVAGLERERLPHAITPGAGFPARAAAERRAVIASHDESGLRAGWPRPCGGTSG